MLVDLLLGFVTAISHEKSVDSNRIDYHPCVTNQLLRKMWDVKCGTHKSVNDVLDEYPSNFLKKRISIKPDGHCLPRAVFNGIKRKGFLVGYSNYKQLLRHTYNDLYLDWIVDSKENIIQELKEYEQNKNYTTDIADTVIVALAAISKATIVAGACIYKWTIQLIVDKSALSVTTEINFLILMCL